MAGSGTSQVLKRGGEVERFDAPKLAAAMHRGMTAAGEGTFDDARQLAAAIEIYLTRLERSVVPATAVFEMAVRVLRRVRLSAAGEAMERHRLWRRRHRAALRVRHVDDKITLWDKDWLCALVCGSWQLGRTVGRIVAGCVEDELLDAVDAEYTPRLVARDEVQQRINRCVARWGLVEPVGVRA
ncbi:MAG: hypothetical protein KGY99_07780 [Phycisphaerae bacterium]|nr:hypothetical protein [Phycisphaerae bacterium]